MAQNTVGLCVQKGWALDVIVGNSASEAVTSQLIQHDLSPRGRPLVAIGIQLALSEFQRLVGRVFSATARAIGAIPFAIRSFSGTSSDHNRTVTLLAGYGLYCKQTGLHHAPFIMTQ